MNGIRMISKGRGFKFSGAEGLLTTEHAASSYGIPVLVIDGEAHGPADLEAEDFPGTERTWTPVPRMLPGAPEVSYLLEMTKEEVLGWVNPEDLALIRKAQEAGFKIAL